MSSSVQAAPARSPRLSSAGLRSLLRDRPVIPLIVLLVGLVLIVELLQPGIVNERWISNTIKFAIPLAILAAAQTLTMLTGGIDLSVGVVATMTAFVMATQVAWIDPVLAIPLALGCAALAGLGERHRRRHLPGPPADHDPGRRRWSSRGCCSCISASCWAAAWTCRRPSPGSGSGRSFGNIPNALLVFIPVALFMGLLLRRTGFGRLLYAIGDNEGATRLAGVRYWQVIIVLYILAAILAGIGGLLYVGLIKANTLSLAVPLVLPSVAAAVIGGTSIFGGRGGYTGTIVGALILQVLATLLLVLAGAGGHSPRRLRAHHPGRHGSLHAHHRGALRASAHGGRHAPHRPRPGRHQHQVGAGGARRWRLADARPGPGTDRRVRRRDDGRAAAGTAGHRGPGPARAAPSTSLGVAVPGLYIPETGVVTFLTNVPGDWSATPVGDPVAEATGLPTALINDARAFGLAELRFGAGRDVRNFVGLTLGTGIGGVFAIDDQVVQGYRGQAGELGHQTIDPDGPWCGCGNRGCVEAYARADQVAIVCGTADPREAIEKARAGDERARAGLAEIGRYLGIGIANAITVLTPERIILGGGWANAGDLIIEPIKAEMRRRVITTPVERIDVVQAELGTWAGAIGAAVHGAERTAGAGGPGRGGGPASGA